MSDNLFEHRLQVRCTREEIQEVLMQATAYAGVPAGVDAFRIATQLFAEIDGKRAG